ncbi:uncharacterized protein [Anabrus simplex]|uniref:uncharacterized protein isoform X2 n=1 Tax=Anabrus simplex TaxID=316456 RepID=UPI0035A3C5CF
MFLQNLSFITLIVMVLGEETTQAQNETDSAISLLYLGTGLQDVVLNTISSCPELFRLKRDQQVPAQSFLCRILLIFQEPQKEMTGRAYYGGPAYHTSGFEPLTLLAGLAFLAFLLQTLHALLYRNPPASSITPVAISRASKQTETQLAHTVSSAVEKYENLNEERGFQPDVSWTSLPAKIGNIISDYWRSKTNTPCGNSIICRVLHKHRQRP